MGDWMYRRCVPFKCCWVCTNEVRKHLARTVIPALIIYHFSTTGFFQRHERGWNLKGKVWKPSSSLTFILYSKQMSESIWDESKSLALSLPLKVMRVINLYWRGSQILPWTPRPPQPSSELLWIKRLSFIPPANPAVWCLVSQCLQSNRDQEIAVRGQQISLCMVCVNSSHGEVVLACGVVKAGWINFRRPASQTFTRLTKQLPEKFLMKMKHLSEVYELQ